MPAKRRAASKANEAIKAVEDTKTRRSGRSASTTATAAVTSGSKRKASPSPSPSSGKAKKGRTKSPSPAPTNRQSSRGRGAAAKKEETNKNNTPKGKGRVTRNVVQEIEEQKAPEPKGRSSSRSTKAPATPKQAATPKAKAATPKKAQTPKQKPASPAKRSTTPKKTVTPKEAKKTPKQTAVTPKQKAAKQKPSPKQKTPTPTKQKVTPVKKSPSKPTVKSSPAPKTTSRSRSRRGKDEEADESTNKDKEKETEPEAAVEEGDAADDAAPQEESPTPVVEATEQVTEKDEVQDKPEADEETEDVVEKEDENVEEDQPDKVSQEVESESVTENKENEESVSEAQEAKATSPEPDAMETDDVEDQEQEAADEEIGDEPAESEQVESDEKECESAESEQISATEPVVEEVASASNPAENVIDVNDEQDDVNDEQDDEMGDSVEVISDTSDKAQADVIDLNEDSGEAVVIGEDPALVHDVEGDGSGDKGADSKTSGADAVEEISDDEDDIEEIGINGEAAPNEVGNGESDESVDNTNKRKIDQVDDETEVEEVKKVRVEEQNIENGEENVEDVVKNYEVIEMDDVPAANSEEVLNSLPNIENSATNNTEQTEVVDPVFNRVFIPNPAFTSSLDTSKQFSVVSYNMLADCHLFRNDYSFTEGKYLSPDYRLTKVIEELKYLDGDVICMQEVDPDYFDGQLLPALKSLGYDGFHKKRTQDFYQEGEATFYKTSKFTLVDYTLSSLSELVNKQLTEGLDPTVQTAVQKYMDLADVVIITKLKCTATEQEVTIGNVHIVWAEMKTPDAQCVQIASAVREIVAKAGSDNFPHIICGDFNSPPMSPGYLVACDGYPSGDETINKLMALEGLELPEGKRSSLVNAVWPAFQHTSSSLKSAYLEAQGNEPEVTSYNRVMCSCVDYIFYSSSCLENVGVLQTPGKDRIMESGGIPNCNFPSDHVSMKAVLSFK